MSRVPRVSSLRFASSYKIPFGILIPALANNSRDFHLFIASELACGFEPVYGMPRLDNFACNSPFSPQSPCIAMKADVYFRKLSPTSDNDFTSRTSALIPASTSALQTAAPLLSETSRSLLSPPHKTATLSKIFVLIFAIS